MSGQGMFLSTWRSQTDLRTARQLPHGVGDQGWGEALIQSYRECGLQGEWERGETGGAGEEMETVSGCEASEGHFRFTSSRYNSLTFGVWWW